MAANYEPVACDFGDGHGGRLPWAAVAGKTFERLPRLATRGNKEAKTYATVTTVRSTCF